MFRINSNGLKIRPLLFNDLPYVKIIRDECLEYIHNNKSIPLKDSQNWYLDNYPPYLVIEKQNSIIGYFRISNLKRKSCSVGLDLTISQRGKGIGFFVYKEVLIKLIEFGVIKISLKVLKSNFLALRLYKKLGFNEIENYKNKFDLLMELDLLKFKAISKI